MGGPIQQYAKGTIGIGTNGARDTAEDIRSIAFVVRGYRPGVVLEFPPFPGTVHVLEELEELGALLGLGRLVAVDPNSAVASRFCIRGTAKPKEILKQVRFGSALFVGS